MLAITINSNKTVHAATTATSGPICGSDRYRNAARGSRTFVPVGHEVTCTKCLRHEGAETAEQATVAAPSARRACPDCGTMFNPAVGCGMCL